MSNCRRPDAKHRPARTTAALGLSLVLGLSLGLGLAGLLANGSTALADEQAELVAKGRDLAEGNCKRCHAIGAEPASPHQSAPPFRLIAERYPSENLAEALAEGIVAGHPDMPVFVMKPDQIEAFLAYLNSLEPPKK